MSNFFRWFYRYICDILDGFREIFRGIGSIFNIGHHLSVLKAFSKNFGVADWILAMLVVLILIAICVLFVFLMVVLLRRYLRFRKGFSRFEDIVEEADALRIRVAELAAEKERSRPLTLKTGEAPSEQPVVAAHRFTKLAEVDAMYRKYVPPKYRGKFSLSDLCTDFRSFACSRLHLFYDMRTIRLFFSALATGKLILLQGISGTGKTSLPYAVGKFFASDATVVSVQPSFNDRADLFGYFNEFTMKFNETELLRRIYDASYNDNMNLIVLDEMNIARVEYYFAEMLSVMEMPNPDEWKIELVSSVWQNDPTKLKDGKLFVPQNLWYIGTANNDDSTFAVSDKVYDRALTLNIDEKGKHFSAPDTPPSPIAFSDFRDVCQAAAETHPISADLLEKLDRLDAFIMQRFRIAFGNRIVKQMKAFIPVYVACGGDALDGLDHILETKILRKLESLNLSLLHGAMDDLILCLNSLFGHGKMSHSLAYLARISNSG